ncbi:MAG: bifunctional methylenetetrahydrofolate dehydrogenase/methenyltetrahydrofolate cyclohydrolase [Actinomycetota bacterium]
MSALILDGKKCAAEIKLELKARTAALSKQLGLGTILVGDDAGSKAYVEGKHRDCAEVGINSIRIELPANVSQKDVMAAISELNAAQECTGYIVQLPLPSHIDAPKILEAIDPAKDADGLHPNNLGKLILGQRAPMPCTPRAIVELLVRNNISLNGRDVTVIGRGLTVGRPLSLLLSNKDVNATVTIVHTGTKDLAAHTKRADIVIAALGRAHFLHAAMVKPGVVAVDVGITRTSNGLQGDLHPDIASVAAAYSPMPGGVGPITRAMLLHNLIELAER